MSNNIHQRTVAIVGEDALQTLKKKHVAIFGIGGVGGHAAEALARAGVGELSLIDGDIVNLSNINRQIIALQSTVGQPKAAVMQARIHDIDPQTIVHAHHLFFRTREDFSFHGVDYIIDAIDSIPSKLELVKCAKEAGIPIISAMGAGNKMYPERFKISDIFKTSYDPIAKKMRKLLKECGINALKVVYSEEQPINTNVEGENASTPASISFVPGVMGMIMAGECIKEMIHYGANA